MPDQWNLDNGTLYYSGTVAGTASNISVWTNWVSTSTTYIPSVWNTWVTTAGTMSGDVRPGTFKYTAPAETEEQKAAREAREAEQRERYALMDRLEREKRALQKMSEYAAKQKARFILEENLTEEQREQLRDNDWFEVVTPKGTYRIRNGWSGNVDRYVDGRRTDVYCIHPREHVPTEDNMLIQKLWLETDEESFLRVANRSTPYA